MAKKHTIMRSRNTLIDLTYWQIKLIDLREPDNSVGVKKECLIALQDNLNYAMLCIRSVWAKGGAQRNTPHVSEARMRGPKVQLVN